MEKEKLDKILQAAHVAPTAANLQPVHLIAVESKEGLEKISKGANIYNAGLLILANFIIVTCVLIILSMNGII